MRVRNQTLLLCLSEIALLMVVAALTTGGSPRRSSPPPTGGLGIAGDANRDTASGRGWWSGVLAFNSSEDYAREVWTAADRYAADGPRQRLS